MVPGAGKLEMKFTPADGSAPIEHVIYDFNGGGVAMGMYNTDQVCFWTYPFCVILIIFYNFIGLRYG